MQKYKLLVIQGCPRSGTTALADVLNSHENLAILYEYDLIKNDLEHFLKSTEKLILLSKNTKKIIYFGDKLPGYFYYYDNLKYRYNNLKIIHISRNPIKTINSMMIRTKNSKNNWDNNWNRFLTLKDACNYWIQSWNNLIKNKCPSILHLKYEDLIKNPEIELSKISNFLEINNNFNTSIIRNIEKPVILTQSDIKYINEHLSKIINDWNLDLEELENKYPKIKNMPFGNTKRILKDYLWEIQKKFKNENSNIS